MVQARRDQRGHVGGTIRVLGLAALLTGLATPSTAREGVNLPGADYDNFAAISALVCKQTCAADARCRAWTWVKPGFQGPKARCWLKHSVPALVRDRCCDSGPASYIEAERLVPEENINRPGNDQRDFATPKYQLCQDACAADAQCSAWTWVRPGVQGAEGHCWLKNGAPHPVPDSSCTSGVKLRPRVVRID